MWKHVLWRKILWNPLLYNWISCYTNQIFGSVLMLTCMWRGRDLTTFPFEYGIASFHPFTSSNYHLHVIFPPVLQWRQNVLNLIIWASHFEPRHCIIFLFLGKLCLIIERHWKLWVWVGCLFLFRKFNVEKVHCGKATPPIKDCCTPVGEKASSIHFARGRSLIALRFSWSNDMFEVSLDVLLRLFRVEHENIGDSIYEHPFNVIVALLTAFVRHEVNFNIRYDDKNSKLAFEMCNVFL